MSERDARVEEIAAELHEQYLATARRLRWTLKPNVNAPYPKLSEDAKELDRVFARWHLAHIDRLTAETERLRALAYIGECQFDDLTWKSRCDELVTDLRSAEARVAALEAALRNTAGRVDGDGKPCWCLTELSSGLWVNGHAPYCVTARAALARPTPTPQCTSDMAPDWCREPYCPVHGQEPPAIPMLLYCPQCGLQHIDREEWASRLHRTHRCDGCGTEWRPSVVPTVGVESLPEPPMPGEGARG